MGIEITLLLLALGLLVALSGTFSGSETALFSLDRLQIRRFERSSSRRERMIAGAVTHPERLLAGILFGNTLVNVASSSVAVVVARRMDWMLREDTLVVLAVFADTLLLLILGEIIPKGVAVQWPAATARFYIPVLSPLLGAVRPVARLLERTAIGILRLWGVRVRKLGGGGLSRPELQLLFEDIRQDEGFTEGEGNLAANIFGFFETRAWEIMTPRVDVRGIPVDRPREVRRKHVLEARHTRLPVYRGSLDHIIGFINAKEYLLEPDRPLEELLKPVHYVPERARVHGILGEVQARRLNMVVVVNEHGGTSGIITNKDLVEEVVGEFFDERGEDLEPEVRRLGERSWRVDGLVPVPEFTELTGVVLSPGPAQTVAGHVAHRLGRPPRAGDAVREGAATLRVLEVVRHRAKRLEIEVDDREGEPS